MKTLRHFLLLGLALISIFAITSCNKNDEGGESSKGLIGWYADTDQAIYWFNFLLDEEGYYEINSQGEIILVQNMWGEIFRDKINSRHTFYQIVDDNTIIRYSGLLYEYGASAAYGKKVLFKFDYKNLGTLAFYETSSTYFTYYVVDNKLYTTEYEIYTILPDGIIPDGSSRPLVKYNPDVTY